MVEPGQPIPHRARIDAALEAAERLELLARQNADELGEDGAQPHLVAALSSFETAIRAERLRLATRASDEASDEQQALAV